MAWLYRDPRLFALTILMIIAAGASALMSIGRQEDPTITNLFATIVTPFPGADPGRVEALVTEKIEAKLREIPEIDTIESTSRTGISVISVQLSQFISDAQIEQAWSTIRDALSDAARDLPPGVPEPDFDDDRTGAFTTISALTMADGRELQPGLLRRYAEILQDRIRNVSGTKFVDLYGERTEEILVEIDPLKLSALGIPAATVSGAIRAADSKVRAGQVRGRGADLVIEVAGEIESLDRIRQVPIVTAENGRLVRVGDIAEVTRALKSPPETLSYADGKPAVLIAARMEDDLQVDTWTTRIKRELAGFEAELPAGITHTLLFDQSLYTADRLQTVLTNLLIGVAIVVGVLIITLGWRSAFIVAVILPLASLISVFGLLMSGIPIHQMSVTGLIVALGLLVDAGIVMVDDIRRRLSAGAERRAAVSDAIKRLTGPLLASTVTTALAFMPMILLPGPAGDFVGAIALAVVIMLVASLALALTVTPALAGWMLPSAKHTAGKSASAESAKSKRTGLFMSSMRLALARPRLAILASLMFPVIGFASFPTLKAQFFPGVDRDQLYVQLKLPEGTAIAETDRTVKKASQIIRGVGGIKHLHWVIGRSAPAFYYNMLANQDNQPAFAEALVTTVSPAKTEEVIPLLQRMLDAELPEARVTVRGLVQGPPVNAPVEVRIVGEDLGVLRDAGERLRRIMLDVPDIIQARTQIVAGAPKAEVAFSEERLRLTGLTLGDAARQLEAMLEGTTGGSLLERSEELAVRVRVGDANRSSLADILDFNLTPPNAAGSAASGTYPGIPISAVGTVRLAPAESPIYRRNGLRINTVQGFVHRDILPEEALQKVLARIEAENFTLPDGYRFELGGDSDARDETIRNLMASLGLIVALTIATIVLTFGSYRLAGVTLIVAVLSMGLSLLALTIFRYPFGIQAVIGVIGSIGVSINAAIIIMTALQADRRALGGDLEQIAELVVAQSRHIISTTLTTFGGFLPLILAGGGFWPPFAMAIAGGVLLSTVVSFYFTPPVFALLARNGRLLSTRPPHERTSHADGPSEPSALPATA